MRRLLILTGVALLIASPDALASRIGGVVPDVPTGTHLHAAARGANVDYSGGPVMHSNRTHIIFWNPSGAGLSWDPGYQSTIEAYLTNVAADSRRPTNVFGLTGQYGDTTGRAEYNSTYAGAINDTDPAPANDCTLPGTAPPWAICLQDGDLQTEIEHVISANHLPTTALTDLYFLVTPAGFGSCMGPGPVDCSLGGSMFQGYCGYHSLVGATPYAVEPYADEPSHCQSGNPAPNGTSDPTINTMSHEQSEAVTDPEGDAWYDTSNNQEVGDLCATTYRNLGGYTQVINGGRYYLQDEWSNDDGSCQAQDETNSAGISAPASSTAGASDSFTVAAATDPDGGIASYFWSFGDGATGTGSPVGHAYQRSGAYTVTLTTFDTAGNIATASSTISVAPPKLSFKVLKRHRLKITVPLGGTLKVGRKTKHLGGPGTVTFKNLHGKVRVRFTSAAGDVVTKTVKLR